MKHIIIFAFLLISVSTPAQSVEVGKLVNDSLSLVKLTGETYFEIKGYNGEQFYNKNWMKGDILLSTGEMIYNEELRYNGLFDELIWYNSSVYQQFKLDKPLISEFWLKNADKPSIHFKQITVDSLTATAKPSNIFAEVGVEGKICLYIQRKISKVNENNVSIDGVLYLQETIKPTPVYYLKLNSNSYVLLEKIKLKPFLQLFPDKSKQIARLVRNNNLKFKTEADLIRLISLLNGTDSPNN